MNSNLKRINTFTNDIIFVDGFWGCGKSVVTSLVGSLAGVEKKKVEHIYEYLCATNLLGKISDDATVALLKTYADLSQYNNLIGREVNLRWSDDSGVRNNPGSLKYIKRLFQRDGDLLVQKIHAENLALLIASHAILPDSNILYDAYGSRLRLVVVMRHPIHLFNNVYGYLESFDRSREFTLSFEHSGVKVPCYARGWEDEYVVSSNTDRALLLIARIQKTMVKTIDQKNQSKHQLLVLAFEDVVLNPNVALTQLETFLDRSRTRRTKLVFRRQKLPRSQISAGKSTSSFSFTSTVSTKESDVYSQISDSIDRTGSPAAIQEFRQSITNYNHRWPSPLAALESSWDK